MAVTASQMVELGTPAPDFTLPDTVSGNDVSLDDITSDQATVVMFICNHCPYVQHINEELVTLANEYQEKGVSFVGISSNDITAFPEDAPDKMKEVAEELGYPFPYLYDESQDVAKAYGATCTPDFFIYDENVELAYRGQFDGSRPRNDVPVTGEDVRAALDSLLTGEPVSPEQTPSMGCNIKWK